MKMKPVVLAALGLCAVLGCEKKAAPTSAPSPAPGAGGGFSIGAGGVGLEPQMEAGRAAFATGMCSKCHGDDGTGGARAPDLTDDEWLHCDGSVAGIRSVLVSGVPEEKLDDPARPFPMNPATRLVAEDQLDALAAFVKSLSEG